MLKHLSRRTMLAGTSLLSAAALLPGKVFAQSTPSRSSAGLPARKEFVVRGAQVLTMDDALGDFTQGDVHVRDGAIVDVGPNVNAPGAEIVVGKDMICMPGFVDTHWHHWTTFLRSAM